MSIPAAGWQLLAACREVDPELFFPESLPGTEAYAAQVEQAAEVCLGCRVLRECGDLAVARREKIGVWAAMTGDAIEAEARRRAKRTARRAA